MLTTEKRKLTAIGKRERFKNVFEKLSTNQEIDYNDKSFILGVGILFLKHFEIDKRYLSYADISYYIILKYSLTYSDFKPLYDYAVNFGFYPIVRSIIDQERIDENKFSNYLVNQRLEEFRNPNNYIETLEQNIASSSFLEDPVNEKSYLAPTSFGKSSIIIDYIRRSVGHNEKVGIIVPTKSLLMQTYQMIRHANLNKRIIIHDEMYNNEHEFIAVFTQERALRLLNRRDIAYDHLIIDEAHNILKHDSGKRQILLSRLISKNLTINENQNVVYLSPLVENVNNLKVNSNQSISSHHVRFNIKEPEIFELTIDNSKYQYDRFTNQFYLLESALPNKFSYIISNSKKKNFIYENSPVRIEELAKQFVEQLPVIENNEAINDVIRVLSTEVHKDFYGISFIKHGLIYLHGKLPDIIKEYLESKFRAIQSIKYLVANTVILEGINLPFEALFILNTYRLQGKELINLIGRINRLNDIFSAPEVDLEKLLPKVHFINNKNYTDGHNGKIKILRSRVFDDKIENPLLDNYDDTNLNTEEKEKVDQLRQNEQFLFSQAETEFDRTKQYLIESGIYYFYENIDSFINSYNSKKEQIENGEIENWNTLGLFEKIFLMFIEQHEILDFEVQRLKYPEARNYYDNYIYNLRKLSFNERITNQVNYFNVIASNDDPQRRKLYFGQTYGEVRYNESNQNERDVYVYLDRKSETEKVNLAIVKLKMEDDFIGFKLNKFVVMLHDYELITHTEYNLFVYGTDDEMKISLTKTGLTISLINKLENDNQLENISYDDYNNLVANQSFLTYMNSVNDLYRYELGKYIQ